MKYTLKALPILIFFIAIGLFFFSGRRLEKELLRPLIESAPIKQVLSVVKGRVGGDLNYQELDRGYLTVPILYYHHIGFLEDVSDEFRQLITVKPSNFKDQMRMLKDEGFVTITLKDLLLGLRGEIEVPNKSVILTFDDGYRDCYEYVYPILSELGFKSINFVILNSLDLDDNLTVSQVRKMLGSGLFEVGAHSVSHANLKAKPEEQMVREVRDSKDALEKKLKTNIDFFAYPGGFFDNGVKDAVKNSGMLGSVTTVSGIKHSLRDMYELKRVRVGDWDGEGLKRNLESLGIVF